MLDRADFIECVPTMLFHRTDDLSVSTRWRETAMDLRARILVLPGVSRPGSGHLPRAMLGADSGGNE